LALDFLVNLKEKYKNFQKENKKISFKERLQKKSINSQLQSLIKEIKGLSMENMLGKLSK